ncbi:MAG: hypothetical protein PF518_13780 [Spirochaetaceae bacterium]|jgi:hypothetical protein|nr:hypothetical protein [Spirochaetaceae bacterium]
MVKRAINVAVSYTSPSITLNFTTDDSLARTGKIWIYDNSGNYICSSDRFVDDNGIVCSDLITGFNTNGTANTFTVDLSNDLSSSISTAGTYNVVVLYDGKQYSNGSYSNLSVSVRNTPSMSSPICKEVMHSLPMMYQKFSLKPSGKPEALMQKILKDIYFPGSIQNPQELWNLIPSEI